MTDVIVCPRCGAQCWRTATFCFACGGGLVPTAQPAAAPVPAQAVAPAPAQQFAPPRYAAPQFAPAAPIAPAAPQAWPAQQAPQWPGAAQYGAPPAGYVPAAAPAYSPSAYPPAGYPGYASYPVASQSGQFGAITAKPIGILFLVATEIVIGAVGLWVAWGLLGWVWYGLEYSDTGEVPLDFVMGLAYLVTSGLLIAASRGIWTSKQVAWLGAMILNGVFLSLILVSVVPWGVTFMDIIGIAANATMLVALNVNPIRQLFGYKPLF